MNRRDSRTGQVWWLAAGLATVGTGCLLLLFSLQPVEPEPVDGKQGPPREMTDVGLTRLAQDSTDNLMAEEARFFDPTPLFLPTEWNADQKGLPDSILRNPNRLFADYPAKLQFAQDELALTFAPPNRLPASPAEVLSQLHDQTPYLGMGREDEQVPTLVSRGGLLQIVAVQTGRVVLAQPLPAAAPPAGFWRPFEVMAVVNAAGLVGRLSTVVSSGVEEVDIYFQNHLAETFRIGQRLPPGFYRVCVGP
jgi:hypothetical protein